MLVFAQILSEEPRLEEKKKGERERGGLFQYHKCERVHNLKHLKHLNQLMMEYFKNDVKICYFEYRTKLVLI